MGEPFRMEPAKMPALAAAPRPSAPPPPPAGGMVFDPWRSLRKHSILASSVALIVILLGLPVAWIKGSPKYSAEAVIYVSPRFMANLQDDKEFQLQSNSEYREYVQQNVRTINRFDIVLEALKKAGPGAGWVKSGETVEHAAERLQGALDVKPVPDTYQIAVSLEGSRPNGLAEIVNAVVNTYLAKAKSEELYASDQRVADLVADRNRLQQEIDQKQASRLALAQELGVSAFTENHINPYDHLLVGAKESLAEAQKQQIDAEAQLGSLDEKQRNGGGDALRAMAQDLAAKDITYISMIGNLNARRSQLLTSIVGLGKNHPVRVAAEQELRQNEKERDDTYQRLVDHYSRELLDQRKAEAYRSERVHKDLSSEVDDQTSKASWFTSKYQQGIQLGLDIDRNRKRMDSIDERISFLSLEKRAPGFVRMFSAARPPTQPSKGGRKKLFGIFFAAGILLGLIVPVGVDMIDPRLHAPADVEKVLGFTPIAWMLEKQEAGPDFAREQMLRLANRIIQEQESANSRIFAFTSVKARGGTSTIVVETAHALNHLGIHALAVEANAYRADPRYRNPHSRGLTVVLQGNQPVDRAVAAGDSVMPDHIPVGDISNERNLPDIQNLVAVLKQAAESYSVVLVDLPPILVSVDAEFVARVSDVAVLVVEAESVTKGELRRAARSLERIQAPAVSAILNRVRAEAAGGFGAAALEEFQTGSTPKQSKWLSPWLWR